MSFLLGIVVFALFVLAASARDPIGVGYLLSSDVDRVAEARLSEPLYSIPPVYVVASVAAGAGAVAALVDRPPLVGWAAGVILSTFLLLTLWDMRHRRGTLAIYIRLRREEIGASAPGDVIEVPKLMFLVMNQPTPVAWLISGIAFAAAGVVLIPRHTWVGALALLIPAAVLVWFWARNRGNPWERLARRLRWVSFKRGHALIDRLHHALDLDPEVVALRHEADAAVARIITSAL